MKTKGKTVKKSPSITSSLSFPVGKIQIDESRHSRRLDELLMSKRLRNVLSNSGYRTLGELDGKYYEQINRNRSCGVVAARELFVLINQLETGIEPVENVPLERITIPDRFHSQPLSKYGLSVRLQNILCKLDCAVLGDLHGKNYGDFRRYKGCGANSMKELYTLIADLHAARVPPGK